MTRIIIVAYACDPVGSGEPNVGWRYVSGAAECFTDVVLITRINNVALLADHLPGNVKVLGVEAGNFWQRIKKGQRFVHFYYLAWQRTARSVVERVCSESDVDVVHHVTFASLALPPTAILGAPSETFTIVGPVGGTAKIDWRLARAVLPPVALLREVVRELNIRRALSSSRLRLILAATDDLILSSSLERVGGSEARVSNQAGFSPAEIPRLSEHPDSLARPANEVQVVMTGRLEAFKGHRMMLMAMRLRPNFRLHVCGDGPEMYRLRRIADAYGVSERVVWHGKLARAEMFDVLNRSHVFVSLSLRESGPLSVVEAYAAGCGVVYLEAGNITGLVPPDARRMIGRHLSLDATVVDLANGVDAVASRRITVDANHLHSLTWTARTRQAYINVSERL